MSTVSLGINAVLSYGTVGSSRASWGTVGSDGAYSGAGPSLTEYGNVRSVTLTVDDGEANATIRATRPFKLTAQALTDAEIEIEALWNPTNAGQKAFLSAKFLRQSIPVAVLDQAQANSGACGLWADFAVMSLTREEGEDKEILLKLKLKPTLGSTTVLAPQWVEVP